MVIIIIIIIIIMDIIHRFGCSQVQLYPNWLVPWGPSE
jgi:hypothetical protein